MLRVARNTNTSGGSAVTQPEPGDAIEAVSSSIYTVGQKEFDRTSVLDLKDWRPGDDKFLNISLKPPGDHYEVKLTGKVQSGPGVKAFTYALHEGTGGVGKKNRYLKVEVTWSGAQFIPKNGTPIEMGIRNDGSKAWFFLPDRDKPSFGAEIGPAKRDKDISQIVIKAYPKSYAPRIQMVARTLGVALFTLLPVYFAYKAGELSCSNSNEPDFDLLAASQLLVREVVINSFPPALGFIVKNFVFSN